MSTYTADKTLRWVNDTRRIQHIGPPLASLPPGVPGSGCECPVALAIGAQCHVSHAAVVLYAGDKETEDHTISLPLYVVDFIAAFDAGLYPELELPPLDEDGEPIAPYTVDA